MINLNDMIEAEIENGYGDANAQAKVYLGRLRTTDKKWLDEDLDEILKGLVDFIDSLD